MPTIQDHENNFFFTRTAVVIPTITGLISASSSLMIMAFIIRSRKNSIYHRILFFISVGDLLSSFAVALTTIPMPRDVVYAFRGPSYGNIQTCEAQAFLYLFGNALVIFSGSILLVYYLCTLVCNISEEVFRRYIEPGLYIANVTGSTATLSILLLKQDMLNPTTIDPFCGPALYPAGCTKLKDPDCRGSPEDEEIYLIMFTFTLSLLFAMLIITICGVFSKRLKQRFLSSVESTSPFSCETDGEIAISAADFLRQSNMNTMAKQILLYAGAYVFTWTNTVLSLFPSLLKLQYVQLLRMTFQPLQGFFNMLIFFFHKVDTVRKNDEDLTIREALFIVFVSPKECPDIFAISNIAFIYENEEMPTFMESLPVESPPVVIYEDNSQDATSTVVSSGPLRPPPVQFADHENSKNSAATETNVPPREFYDQANPRSKDSRKRHYADDSSLFSQSLGGFSAKKNIASTSSYSEEHQKRKGSMKQHGDNNSVLSQFLLGLLQKHESDNFKEKETERAENDP